MSGLIIINNIQIPSIPWLEKKRLKRTPINRIICSGRLYFVRLSDVWAKISTRRRRGTCDSHPATANWSSWLGPPARSQRTSSWITSRSSKATPAPACATGSFCSTGMTLSHYRYRWSNLEELYKNLWVTDATLVILTVTMIQEKYIPSAMTFLISEIILYYV